MRNLRETEIEIIQVFNQAYLDRSQINPVSYLNDPKLGSVFNQYIYSWEALPELIIGLKNKSSRLFPDDWDYEEERLECHTIRFVIDTNGEIWFAPEGQISRSTPAHSDMVNNNPVMSAGNLVFSDDYSKIIEVNNKSGHFFPEFHSLVFVLQALLSLELDVEFPVKLDENITISKLVKKDTVPQLMLSKHQLQQELIAEITPPAPASIFMKCRTSDGVLEEWSRSAFKERTIRPNYKKQHPEFIALPPPSLFDLQSSPKRSFGCFVQSGMGLFQPSSPISCNSDLDRKWQQSKLASPRKSPGVQERPTPCSPNFKTARLFALSPSDAYENSNKENMSCVNNR